MAGIAASRTHIQHLKWVAKYAALTNETDPLRIQLQLLHCQARPRFAHFHQAFLVLLLKSG